MRIKNFFTIILLTLIFILVTYFSYFNNIGQEFDRVFVTLATFLFSIFTGFFISNQNGRYGKIRDILSQFDGKLSSIYRAGMHLGEDFHKKIGEIIKNHYEVIIQKNSWDYNFVNKSSTITSLHLVLQNFCDNKEKISEIEKQALGRITSALSDLQPLRKQIVALREERIPFFQWVLVVLFGLSLLITVFSLPSFGFLIGSILKGAFTVSIISVLIILKSFDNLSFFEGRIGEHSARDVLDIISGGK